MTTSKIEEQPARRKKSFYRIVQTFSWPGERQLVAMTVTRLWFGSGPYRGECQNMGIVLITAAVPEAKAREIAATAVSQLEAGENARVDGYINLWTFKKGGKAAILNRRLISPECLLTARKPQNLAVPGSELPVYEVFRRPGQKPSGYVVGRGSVD